MHIIILAGGEGTRLWPLSRHDFPKQFLQFGDHQSLLQKSVSRFLRSSITESISISTNAQYEPLVRMQLEKVDPQKQVHIIVEPHRKNTAPAIAFALKHLQEKLKISEEASILVLPSDHFLEPQEIFLFHLEQIQPLIRQNRLVLFGSKPTKPETGYGYIQIGEKHDNFTYLVKQFVEKPDLARAKNYLKSEQYYWNMGMFAFSVRLFFQKLSIHAPNIEQLMQGPLEKIPFEQMPSISFDYAILEKCHDTLICPLPVQWSDVGSWDSVYDVMKKDKNRNVKVGNVVDIETKNSLIIGGKKLISTIGLKDVLIVETEEGIFIAKKGHSQKVKELVEELKRKAVNQM